MNKKGLIFTTLFLILCIGFSLTTWKMFEFRDRLHDIIDNKRFEDRLQSNGIYEKTTIVFFGDSEIDLWWMAPYFGATPIKKSGYFR